MPSASKFSTAVHRFHALYPSRRFPYLKKMEWTSSGRCVTFAVSAANFERDRDWCHELDCNLCQSELSSLHQPWRHWQVDRWPKKRTLMTRKGISFISAYPRRSYSTTTSVSCFKHGDLETSFNESFCATQARHSRRYDTNFSNLHALARYYFKLPPWRITESVWSSTYHPSKTPSER